MVLQTSPRVVRARRRPNDDGEREREEEESPRDTRADNWTIRPRLILRSQSRVKLHPVKSSSLMAAVETKAEVSDTRDRLAFRVTSSLTTAAAGGGDPRDDVLPRRVSHLAERQGINLGRELRSPPFAVSLARSRETRHASGRSRETRDRRYDASRPLYVAQGCGSSGSLLCRVSSRVPRRGELTYISAPFSVPPCNA